MKIKTTYHRDGSATLWDVYRQQFIRFHELPPDAVLASLSAEERRRVLNHFRKLRPDPVADVTGNGEWSHAELADQLEMRGYTVDADTDDNEHSYVRHEMTGDVILGDIHGDSVAVVTNRAEE